MKTFIYFSLVCLITACGPGNVPVKKKPEKKYDPDSPPVSGHVQSYRRTGYMVNDSSGILVKMFKIGYAHTDADIEVFFDKDGLETETKSYDDEGNIKSSTRCTYNDKKQRTGKWFYDEKGKPKQSFSYTYTETGDTLEEIMFDQHSKQLVKYTYTYDEEHFCTEKKLYGPMNDFLNSEKYTYDKEGNKVRSNLYNSKGKQEKGHTYTYDEKGNVLSEHTTNRSGADNKTYDYAYDKDGYRTRKTWYVSGEKFREWAYSYDQNHYLIEVQANEYSEGKIYVSSKTEYINDSQGNWVTMKIYNQGFCTYLAERNIKY